MTLKRDPEATRQALLDAAEAVFLEKGFGDTALSEIARRARITKSLIHHYFGSKEALWREVKQRRFDHYAKDQLAMLTNAEPVTELQLRLERLELPEGIAAVYVKYASLIEIHTP